MALTSYLRHAGRVPASGSVHDTLAPEPPAAAKTAPQPASSSVIDASARKRSQARSEPLKGNALAAASLFDALGLEAGGAAALAPRRGRPPSAQQVAARLAERAAAAARAARAARAAAEEGLGAAAPASQVLFDALALEGGSRAPRRPGAGAPAARRFSSVACQASCVAHAPLAPAGATLSDILAKVEKPRPPVPVAAAFDHRWPRGSSIDSGSTSFPDSASVSPPQTEDQLPPVGFCV